VVTLLLLAGIAVVLGWYTAAQITTQIVGVAPHQFRFLWPLAAFATFAVLLAIGRGARIASGTGAVRLVVAASVLTAVVVVANLPATAAPGGPQVDEPAMPGIRAIDRQLGALRADAPILADWNGIGFQEPYSSAFTAELRRRDIEFVTASEYLVRHFGTARRFNGHNARSKIFYRLGPAASARRLGAFRRVAYYRGSSGEPAIAVYAGPVTARVPRSRT
jgi:hypothetical protein